MDSPGPRRGPNQPPVILAVRLRPPATYATWNNDEPLLPEIRRRSTWSPTFLMRTRTSRACAVAFAPRPSLTVCLRAGPVTPAPTQPPPGLRICASTWAPVGVGGGGGGGDGAAVTV